MNQGWNGRQYGNGLRISRYRKVSRGYYVVYHYYREPGGRVMTLKSTTLATNERQARRQAKRGFSVE